MRPARETTAPKSDSARSSEEALSGNGQSSAAQSAAAQAQDLYSRLTPIAALLNPDGTLAPPAGYQGAVDVRGYHMTTEATGAPRFVPTADGTAAGEGAWDDRFGFPGMSFDAIHALLVDGDDVYAAGWFTEAGALPTANIARWDGRRWGPLGDGVDGTVHALARYKGEVYAAGMLRKAGDVLANGIARWDGTRWQTVGDGFAGEFGDPTVRALAVFKDELYAGGDFVEASGTAAIGIARWDGAAWRAVGGGVTSQPYGGNAHVHALAASKDALYAGGDFDQAGTAEAAAVAAWDGAAWAALGTGIEGEYAADVKALAVLGTKMYAGGSFNKAGSAVANNIAVWDIEAKVWAALGQGVRGEFDAGEVSAVLPIGTSLYVTGTFAFAGSAAAKHVAVWNGSAWSGLVQNGENGTDFPALALAPGAGGSVIIAGDFEWAGGLYANRITRWDGRRFLLFGEGLSSGSDFPPTVNAVAVAADGKVYVGGQFSFAGSAIAENVAMWDGAAWHAMGSGTDGIVFSLATKGDDVYVGGRFTQAGGVGTTHIARWNAATESWHALGSGTNGWVYALAVDGDRVYAGGDFTAAGEVPAEDIAVWDGAAWSVLSSKITFNPNGVIYAIQPDGDFVWIGGDFLSVRVGGGIAEVNGLIVLKKSTDELFAVAGGVTRRASGDVWGTVYALAIAGGALYVGGLFDKAGGQVAANGVARYDGTAWAALGSSVGGEFTQQVNALAIDGANVYAGGQFESTGGATSRAIGRWNAETQTWTGLGRGLSAGSDDGFAVAKALATHEGVLYAGGTFEQADGRPASAFAQWGAARDTPPPAQAILKLEPDQVAFGEVAVGQSIERTITITNAGAATVLTGSVNVPAAPFSLVSDFDLAPNASHVVTVRFAPVTEGAFTEAVSVVHNDSNAPSPATVALSGSGAAPA